MSNNKFYITTAIAYASSKPHIGNAYDIVLADMIARYKKQMGFDVYLMTGSDEHGQKIEEKAKAAGITPKEYVDKSAAVIKGVWDSLNTEYDKFIRTTDDYHEKTVQKIFKKLYDQGDIYKSEYQGKYCVPCESFYTESQLVDGKCPDCGREVIDSKEEAYFLKLSKYQDKLLEYYEQNPNFIVPESRKNEMINNFLKPGLADLCVSRSSFKWGVPVSFDDKHVIYVWIDALSNYITGIGYDTEDNSELYNKLWPADLHVIGKDIVRFHTIYWPIILMALGLPLPKQVLGHPWVLIGEDKMSKSKGNVVYADELAKRFGADAIRYYLISQMPFAQDGTFTYESFINVYNADLANTIGNLVSRTATMTKKYFDGTVTKGALVEELDIELFTFAKQQIEKYHKSMDTYHNADAVSAIIELAKRCNKYIDETTPWALAKDEEKQQRLNDVLYNLCDLIRIIGILLKPIMPETGENMVGASNDERLRLMDLYTPAQTKALFPRLDAEKILAEIAAEQEKVEKTENVATIEQIGIEDFAKVELTAGKVMECEAVPKAKKLLKLTVFDGTENRTVISGIALNYKPEDLVGKTVILVSNLKPAKLCGIESQGMILAADCGKDIKVIFLDGVPAGSKIR